MTNEIQYTDAGECQIGSEDQRLVTRLLGEIAGESGELDRKRCRLISGLSEIVDADGWLWVVGGVDPERKLPMQMGMLSGGLSDQQVAGLYHLSPHTVKGYIRDTYRHFNVSSQLALIRHFRGKEALI